MESKSILRYIVLGAILRYLKDATEGWPIYGERYILDNIDYFLMNLEEFNLPVTIRAADKLRQLREKFAALNSDRKITAVEASELGTTMADLEKTLFAEAEGNIAFIVTDKRIDVNKLLSNVRALMAPSIFDLLPDIARYDFNEAGKCIAFELPTAAAFHLMRGTEAVLRHFYCSVIRRKRVELLWGPMVKELRSRKKPPPEPLLDNLDNIRRSFRNPTQHPDKVYDIQEVQDLFGLCIEVVNRMASLFKKVKKSGCK